MEAEELAKKTLEQFNFKVEKIPESDNETPDYLVFGKNSNYLVEVKSKETAKDLLISRNRALESGNTWEETTAVIRENRIKNIVRKSSSQLKSYTHQEVDFRLVWLHAAGYDTNAQWHLFEASLYGVATVGNFGDGRHLYRCYYFHESDFYFHRNTLDGVIISNSTEGKLLINIYSKNYRKFKECELVQKLGPAVLDPVIEELNGAAYIADHVGDRGETESTLRFLSEKYNRKNLVEVPMKNVVAEERQYDK